MARTTPQEYAEKWARRLKGSTEDVRRGVQRVAQAPGQKAAASQRLMVQKLMEAIESGLWAQQVAGVTLEDWKKAMVEKGITRLASGVDAAQPHQAQMAERLLAAVDSAVAAANAIPKGDIEASVQRMTTYIREMHKRKVRQGR